MKKTFNHLVIFSYILFFASQVMASEKILTVATYLPTKHGMNEKFWPQVKNEVERRTEGRVKLKIEYGLAPPNGLLELVEYGGADISWTFNGYFPGRFSTTKMIELPGYPGGSEAASVAHWRAHKKFFHKAKEFDGVELIGLMVHSPAYLFMHKNKAIKNLSELQGRKMRTAGGVANEIAKVLGISPILSSVTKSYEMISGGVADGTFLPMDTIPLFKLYEVAPNAYSVPGGFYRGSFSIFMNEDALSDISEKDQKALNEYFGEELSKQGGAVWDWDNERGLKVQKEKGRVTEFSKADVKMLKEITQKVKNEVIKDISKKGINGQEAYDFIFETMKDYSSK